MAKHYLDCVFHPRTVAVVGVSTQGEKLQMGGASFVSCLLSSGFDGRIYPINPKGGEALGLTVYPSIRDVPEPVDYVICSVSAEQVPGLIEECAAKEVKAVHVYTGDFLESGSSEGRRREEEIRRLAQERGVRLIGPNCLGVYSPTAGLAYFSDFPRESGPLALICQSGGNSAYLIRKAVNRGLRFSKVVSYGNACDVTESDLLEYLAEDDETRIIIAYIEGVRDGRRFFQVLKETAARKPVIVLKGGTNEAGARAAASHTGSLAGSTAVWDRVLHQANAVRAGSMEELIDMAVTFAFFPLPRGDRAGVLGWGGGATVLAGDDCANEGLAVPLFPQELQGRLAGCLDKGMIGVGLSNPVDVSDQGFGDVMYRFAKIMLGYEGVDLLIHHMVTELGKDTPPDRYAVVLGTIADGVIRAFQESDKPVAVAIPFPIAPYTHDVAVRLKQRYSEAGLPVYHSLRSAARAIRRLIDYHERRGQLRDEAPAGSTGRRR